MTFHDKIDLFDGTRAEMVIDWGFDTGVWLEPGHRHNGYGRGWYLKSLEVFHNGIEVPLDPAEFDHLMEKYHPSRLPASDE